MKPRVSAPQTLLTLALGGAVLLFPTQAKANHPVFLEGNNAANGPANTSTVQPGTAGDYDGDGNVGVAEDTDNATDRVFGTLTAALLAANGGANANGHVIIVTSGRFAESVRIPNTEGGQAMVNGVTVIEAAPGVQANIDAVVAGDPGNAARQAGPGIVIDTTQTDRTVILRNLVIRNFTVGLQIGGNARVTVEKCRFDSNITANVVAGGNSRLTMTECSVNAAGQRFNPMPATANPGHGIVITGTARASIARSTISGNTASGVQNEGRGEVRLIGNNIFDNGRDLVGRFRSPSGDRLRGN
ncbi:MAG TPA: right-handed parallel beta-helix repeat-containing protein [Armatimonadota bacterium]|nr:right-handed parallel beta-helix repeat-containing protein [Armatimonadota bacterium]